MASDLELINKVYGSFAAHIDAARVRSAFEDLTRTASVAKQAIHKKLKVKSAFTITPGSEQVRFTAKRDGILSVFEGIVGMVLATFTPGKLLIVRLRHADGTNEDFPVNHSYNDGQIRWFRAGSAPNLIRQHQQ